MNIILKKTSKESYRYLIRFKSSVLLFFLISQIKVMSQNPNFDRLSFVENITVEEKIVPQIFPNPKAVMRKSMLVPGWGQITNKQVWKVPIVYGLIGGLTYYSISLTKDYHDFRAAYYNLNSDNQDFKFGPTPAYLENINSASLLNQRDFLRNRRDFIYVSIALAYILNFVDAYVFAHLRPFDVSDDLSLNTNFTPSTKSSIMGNEISIVSLKISLKRKRN